MSVFYPSCCALPSGGGQKPNYMIRFGILLGLVVFMFPFSRILMHKLYLQMLS